MLSKVSIAFLFSCFTLALGGETVNQQNLFLAALQNADSVTRTNMVQLNEKETEARRSTALIYSCIMPGSGQTMFGHTYKGVGFTIAAFGSALTAAISHNNFIARNERLDALEYQYSIATNWLSADQIYKDMIGVQKKLVQDRNRRNIFLAISAVVWTVNIVDFLYNTDDMGQTLFSTHSNTRENQIAVVDSPHNPLFSFSIPLQ